MKREKTAWSSISIPKNFHKLIKKYAEEQEITIGEFIENIIDYIIKENENNPPMKTDKKYISVLVRYDKLVKLKKLIEEGRAWKWVNESDAIRDGIINVLEGKWKIPMKREGNGKKKENNNTSI